MSHLDDLLDAYKRFPMIDDYGKSLDKEPPPKIIYHYTDGNGLRGIFASGKLWLTDIFYLNDVSEIRHGVLYACELLRNVANSETVPKIRRKFAETVAKKLTENIEDSAHYFVCCFSRNGDDLGQWRAYADDGRGFAVGFRTAELELDFADKDRAKHSTFPVSYSGDKLREMQSRIVDEATRILDAAGSEVTPQFLTTLSVRLCAFIIHCSIYFKHTGYKYEEEYRFMQVHPGLKPIENLKIRARPYSLVRYTEFDWRANSRETLCEVTIGPAANLPEAKRFIDDCKREYLPKEINIAVRHSTIPYRSI